MLIMRVKVLTVELELRNHLIRTEDLAVLVHMPAPTLASIGVVQVTHPTLDKVGLVSLVNGYYNYPFQNSFIGKVPNSKSGPPEKIVSDNI